MRPFFVITACLCLVESIKPARALTYRNSALRCKLRPEDYSTASHVRGNLDLLHSDKKQGVE